MKAVILAGGFGTRISEESHMKPKPMIEIGGKPIIWHVMKIYSAHGINEFVVCCGYKGYVIKEYFANYFLHMSDVTFDMEHNQMKVHQKNAEPWKVTLVDTGMNSMTGGRLLRVKDYIGKEKFCLTYGDGVSDVNITDVIAYHEKQSCLATVTAIQPSARFGAIEIDEGGAALRFQEKPRGDGQWINGGFFVLEPEVFNYLEGDETVWEQEPLRQLALHGQLSAYKHDGFWGAMDTLRDKTYLEELWNSANAPWKVW